MGSLAAAFFTAALALVAKLLFDAWVRFEDRRGLAGAIAGELSAYLDLLNVEMFVSSLRILASLPKEDRIKRVKSFANLPEGHPVFDSVAAKIGYLGHENAYGISRAYNVVTGMRLLLMGLAQPSFEAISDDEQAAFLRTVAAMIVEEEALARVLVERLKVRAQANYWAPIGGQLAAAFSKARSALTKRRKGR